MAESGPPRLARRILESVIPLQEREAVLGDLDEEFRTVRVPRDGLLVARAWYLGQVARSIGPFITLHGWREDLGMRGWRRDLSGGLRVFRRSPGFAAAVVLTIAVGVGGVTAVFSVVRGVLLTDLPFPDSDRVVVLWGQSRSSPRSPLTVGDYNDLGAGVESFASVAGVWGNDAALQDERGPEQVSVGWVTPAFFDVTRGTARLGRVLEPEAEDQIVISHALWSRRYGADPETVGRIVTLGGTPMQIVGVLPPDLDPNLTAFSGGMASYEVWRNQPSGWTDGDDRQTGWIRAAARLRDGVTVAEAQADVDRVVSAVNARITERDGGLDLRVHVRPVRSDLTQGLARTMWILLAAVGGVLLIASSNVAHLMLGRAESRAGEVAVRSALGGSRMRLLRQLVTESAVLAGVGGVLGAGLAWAGTRILLTWAPASIPRIGEVRVDGLVLGFALGATLLSALLFGLIPAIRASRTDLSTMMGERVVTAGRGGRRLSQGLIVAEVALSLGLLFGTGLLLRSFASLQAEELGFETSGVLTFSLSSPSWGDTDEEAAAKLSDYLTRIREVPGVQSAGVSNRIPLGGGLFTGSIRSEAQEAAEEEPFVVSYRYVTPGYLETLGARLLGGRFPRADDEHGAVVIDQRAAERGWPDQDPVGQRVELTELGSSEPGWGEVVGVVAPMKHAGVADDARETVYQSMLTAGRNVNFRYVVVRTAGEPLRVLDPITAAVRQVDAGTVLARIRSMDQLFSDSVASTRFAAVLLALFGGLAMLLAAVGLYGVMAFSVRQRTREIGIRVALGAEHRAILLTVLRSGVALVLLGVGVGAGLSLSIGRVLESILHDVTPSDPLTLGLAALTIVLVGLVGAYLPARVVLGVDPVRALREE